MFPKNTWWAGESPESSGLVGEEQGPDFHFRWEAADLTCSLILPPQGSPLSLLALRFSSCWFLVLLQPACHTPGSPPPAQLSPRKSCKGLLLSALRGLEVHANSLHRLPTPTPASLSKTQGPEFRLRCYGGESARGQRRGVIPCAVGSEHLSSRADHRCHIRVFSLDTKLVSRDRRPGLGVRWGCQNPNSKSDTRTPCCFLGSEMGSPAFESYTVKEFASF